LFCHCKESDEAEDDVQQLLTVLDNRILPGFDAASLALLIMTANKMPKEVFVEDTIEWVVKLVKWHLFAIVYPHCGTLKGVQYCHFSISYDYNNLNVIAVVIV